MHKPQIRNYKKHHLISRRALSNVVTSAILLSAVSIMGAMMLAWSNTSLNIQKQDLEELFSTQVNKINEDLIFENTSFLSTCPVTKCINVTLGNVGTLGLNITQMKFVDGNTLAELKIFSYTNGGIVPSGSFSTNATYSWSTGDDIDIIVFTDRGNQFNTNVIAP